MQAPMMLAVLCICYASGAAALPFPGRTVAAVPYTCTELCHDDTRKAAWPACHF